MNDKKSGDGIRTRDAGRTREAILMAAINLFAAEGYTHVGIREVAAVAGFHASLVRRYFSTKIVLFEAALDRCLDLSEAFVGERAQFGSRLARIVRADRLGTMLILLLAAADPEAREAVIRALQNKIVDPLETWIDRPDAAVRVARINALCGGVISAWKLLSMKAWRDGLDEATIDWLAESIQMIVDAPAMR